MSKLIQLRFFQGNIFKYIFRACTLSLLLLSFSFIFHANAFAIDNDEINNDCIITVGGVETSLSTSNVPILPNDGQTGTGLASSIKYSFEIKVCPGDFSVLSDDLKTYKGNGERVVANMSTTGFNFNWGGGRANSILTPDGNGCLSGTFESGASSASEFTIDIESETSNTPICRREHGHLSPLQRDEVNNYDVAVSELCDSLEYSPANPTIENEVNITANIPIRFFSDSGYFVNPDGRTYNLGYQFKDTSGDVIDEGERISKNLQGLAYTSLNLKYDDLAVSSYTFDIFLKRERHEDIALCSLSFLVGTNQNPGGPINGNPEDYSICITNLSHNEDALVACNQCMLNFGIWTSIGCISQDPKSIVQKFITVGTGILGGIFLLRVLAAAFMLTTSQGDVKKTSEAKQMITEAIIGVIFVIFSVTILQFIGSDVMQIPGFGG